MKDKLIFDTSALLDADNVGAYLRTEEGALLTHTKVIKPYRPDQAFTDTDVAGNDITVTGHSFQTGDQIEYVVTAGTGDSNLLTNTFYYIIRVDANTVRLAASKEDAESGIAIALAGDASVGAAMNLYGTEQIAKALDVNIVEGINVEVDLDAADDSVASWTHDGAGNAIGSTGGALHIHDADGSITVDAVDLDIRDLSHTQDSVAIGDGTDLLAIESDGSILSRVYDVDGNGISSTDLGGAFALNVYTNNDPALADGAIASAANQLDVADTSEDVVAAPLGNRKYLYIYNDGNKQVYIGGTGVTAANGFPLSPGSVLQMRAGDAMDIEFVGKSGESGSSASIRTLELN